MRKLSRDCGFALKGNQDAKFPTARIGNDNPKVRFVLNSRISFALGLLMTTNLYATSAVAQVASANFYESETVCVGANEIPIATTFSASGGGVLLGTRGLWREGLPGGALVGATYTYSFAPALLPDRFEALWFENIAGFPEALSGGVGIHGNFTVTYSDGSSTSNMLPTISGNTYSWTQDVVSTNLLALTTSTIGGSGPSFNAIVHSGPLSFATNTTEQAFGTLEFSQIDASKSIQSISWSPLDPSNLTAAAQSGARITCAYVPVTEDDSATNRNPGTPTIIDPLANDDDLDGTSDPTTVVLTGVGAPLNSDLSSDGKTLTVPNEGEWTVNLTTGAITFTPLASFAGDPTNAPYTVDDNEGNTSAPATISVTYIDPPRAIADESMDNPLGEPVDVDVLANDSAADGRTLDATTVALLDPAGNPVTTLVVPGEGTWMVAPSGVVTFTPEDGFTGSPTPVRYTVDDDLGNTSAPATITVGYVPDVDIEAIEEVLSDDLARTTRLLSASASNISRRAADRLRVRRGQTCGQEINDLLKSNPVRFASDKFFIDARNDAVLDEITRLLGECSASSFMIAGHTDSDASDAYNITLSQNRVDAVRDALAQRGVSVERLQTQGFGESRPIATNATEEGQALNRRVEFILLDDSITAARACGDDSLLSRNVNGTGNNDGANLAGDFRSTGYNCSTDTYSETWGELSITHEDDRGTTGMLRVGTSRERQNDNTLFGRFIEAYLSKSDVNTPDATGSITGVGLHAGLYGAHGTDGGLILSYYGSGAIGRHNFELDTGAVADGNYTYAGLFAGAAVGGEYATETLTVLPRVGIDLAYAKAIGSEISVPDVDLDIDPATYARGFIELGLSHETDNGTFDVAPRLFCETNGDVDVNACGYGASFNYATLTAENGTQWDVTFDYEQITDRQTASLRVARSRDIFDGLGVSQSSFGATQTGAFEAAQTIAFSW